MDLNNINAEDKLQKYMEFNSTPEGQVGLEYIPNTLPEMDSKVDYSQYLGGEHPLLRKPSKQKVKAVEEVEVDNTPDYDVVRPEDPWDQIMRKSTLYNNKLRASMPVDNDLLKREIAKVESDGLGGYKAQNKTSSAVGKYQFLWSSWGDPIKKVTGVKDKEDFKNSPEAQEKFFDYYKDTVLVPQMKTIRKEFPDVEYTDTDILKLLHFRGLGKKDEEDGGLRTLIKKGKLNSKLESNNVTAADYLKRSKA